MTSWNLFRKSRKAKRRPKSKSPFPRPRYALYFEPLEYRWYPGDVLTALTLSALGSLAFLFRDRLEAQLFPLADGPLSPAGGKDLPALLTETPPNTSAWSAIVSALAEVDTYLLTVPAGPPQPSAMADGPPAASPEAPLSGDWLGQMFGDPLTNPWAGPPAGTRRTLAAGAPETGQATAAGDGAASPPPGSPGGAGGGPFLLGGADPSAREQGAFLNGPLGPGTPPPEDDPPPPEGGTPPGPGARKALPRKPEIQRTYGQVPLHFEPNVGQSDARVQFLSRGRGYDLFFTSTEAVLTLHKPIGEQGRQRGVLRMQLVGANPAAQAVGEERLPGISNYFLGNDPTKWRTNVANYRKVRFANVYPGVDLVYYGTNQRQLEYDFVVQPGANPNVIQMRVQGAEGARLDEHGHLVLPTLGGDVVQQAPVLYQMVNGRRQRVAGRQVLQGADRVGFQVGAYDASRPLYIDPVLSYSSYLGGSWEDYGYAIAVDTTGSVYVTGATISYDFPTASPFQPGHGGDIYDAFVTKVDAAGSVLAYSTYLGGSDWDQGFAIAVDGAGNAYVTGSTVSDDFPGTPGRPPEWSDFEAYITKLDSSGSALVYSRYLGGGADESGDGIAVDGAGNVYVTGYTYSTNFPTANALYGNCGGCHVYSDAFVTKVDASGSGLVYSTYLGGSGDDGGSGIALDAAGNAYVIGLTTSTNYPTAKALQLAYGGGPYDAFVAKVAFNPATQTMSLVYSTYLGGSGSEGGYGLLRGDQGIAVDAAGNAYVTGNTSSTNFPTANPIQPAIAGGSDSFVAKVAFNLATQTTSLVYSTYLGGGANDRAYAIAVDVAGNASVTGYTESTNFPTTNALQPAYGGNSDAIVVKVNATGSALVYSTYLGGNDYDSGHGIAVDSTGSAYLTGTTWSTNFPILNSFQSYGGRGDAFVAKISDPPLQRLNNPVSTWLNAGLDDVALNTGTLRVTHPLDFRRSVPSAQDSASFLGASSALVYNSDTVNVYPIGEVTPRWAASLGRPITIDLDFTWRTQPAVRTTFTTSTTDPAGETYLLAARVQDPQPYEPPVPQTGVYPWTFKAGGVFSGGSRVTYTYSGLAYAVRTDGDGVSDPDPFDSSPFGPGWSLAGLDRIVETNYGPLRVFGSGAAPRLFTPTVGGGYLSPPDDFGTLTKAGVTTYTYTSKDQVRWNFEQSSVAATQFVLKTVVDPHNLAVTYTYKATNQRLLEEVWLPDGGRTTFNYTTDTPPRLNHIQEPGNRYVTFTYTNGNLTTIQNADGGLRNFTYGTGDNLYRIANQKWATQNVTYTYAATGGIVYVERGQGTTVAVTPSNIIGLTTNPAPKAEDSLAWVQDPRGNFTYHDLDGLGRVQRIYRPPLTTSEDWIRDHAGQVRVHADHLVRPTTYTYDYTAAGKGDLKRVDYPDGTNEQFTYDSTFHSVTERKDRGGGRTTFGYNATNDLTSVKDPLHTDGDARETRYGWANGLLQTVTDARGFVTSYTWDAATRRLTDVEDPLTHRTTFLYAADDTGNVRAVWDAENRRTTFHHDGMRRVVTQMNALGGIATFSYNALGQRTSVENPKGQKTAYDYDARGWLTVTTEAAHLPPAADNERRSVTSLYDAAGNLTGVQDPRGNLTQFLYDALNRQTVSIDALDKRVTTLYDAVGNVTQVEDQLGRIATFSYDALNRLRETTEGVGTPLVRTRTLLYDTNGALKEEDDPCTCGPGGVQRTTFLNDALARQTVSIDPANQRVTAIFDQVGNLSEQIDARNNRTTFLYDALNRQTVTIQPVQVSGAYTRITTLYDKVGNVTGVLDQLERLTSFSYDALNRRTAVTEAALVNGNPSPLKRTTTTLYDAVGNVTGVQTPKVGGVNLTQFQYDSLNRLTATIDPIEPVGQTERVYYDKASNVTGTLDKAGRLTSYAYDALNRVTLTTEAAHLPVSPDNERRNTEQVYDAAGNVTVVVDHFGRRTSFLYDALNRQTVTINADNKRTTVLYDNASNVTAVIDARGNETWTQLDALGRVDIIYHPDGGTTNHDYDQNGNLTALVDPNANWTSYTYDALNRRTEVIEGVLTPGQRITTTLYDAAGNATVILSPLLQGINNRTSFLYDALNRSTVTIDPLDRRTTQLYDVAGNVTGVQDPANRLTIYAYDALDRRVAVTEAAHLPDTNPLRRTTTTLYDAVGNTTGVLIPPAGQNNLTAFLYDALNRRTAVIDPLGFRVTTLYDKLGNVTLVQDQLNHWTSYAYDTLNRKVEMTEAAHLASGNPLRRTATYFYDAVGNTTGMRNPQDNRLTSYAYDAMNRVTAVTEAATTPAERTTRTGYDLAGNVTVIIDPINQRTTYILDALNRRTVTIDPLNKRTTVLYDAHSNVTQITDRNLKPRQFTYDPLDRPLKEIWLSGGTPIHTLTTDYDAAGRVTITGDPKATYTYQYDDLDRRTSISNASSTGIPQVVLAQEFDARDRRTTLTATRQGVSDFLNTYSYDALGRLTSLTQKNSGVPPVAFKRVDLSYNPLDQLVTVSRYRGNPASPNLVATSEYFAYDDLNRLRGLTHKNGGTVFATYSWDFDTGDRLTTVNYQYGSATYTYDATDQLKLGSHVYTGPPATINEAYTYDANGNRTGVFQTGPGNRLTTYTSGSSVWTYLYDDEGNRTGRNLKVAGVQTENVQYEWDHRNRLATVTYRTGAGMVVGTVINYTYDAFDRRIAKVVDPDGPGVAPPTTTQYAYDGANVVLTFHGAGAAAQQNNRFFVGPELDQVFADESAAEPHWPLTDQLGTVRDLVWWNPSPGFAEEIKELRYDAFGNIAYDSNPTLLYAYSYAGREYEIDVGLFNLRARYYEPVTGKLISEDPIGFAADDPNFYRYVGNHPTYASDPEGLQEDWSKYVFDTSDFYELSSPGDYLAEARRRELERLIEWHEQERLVERSLVTNVIRRMPSGGQLLAPPYDAKKKPLAEQRCAICHGGSGFVNIAAFPELARFAPQEQLQALDLLSTWRPGKAERVVNRVVDNTLLAPLRLGESVMDSAFVGVSEGAPVPVAIVGAPFHTGAKIIQGLGTAVTRIVMGMGEPEDYVDVGTAVAPFVPKAARGVRRLAEPRGQPVLQTTAPPAAPSTANPGRTQPYAGRDSIPPPRGAETAGSTGGNIPVRTAAPLNAPRTGPVSQLEVGPYGPLARRSVGDGLTPDHIPSFAAVRANIERQLGRPLTAAEARALRDQTNTIVIRTPTHQQGSRTYGGRNTAQQIQTDSQNLQGAFQADRAALRQRLIQDGHTPEAVDAAFQRLDQLNRQAGRY